MQYTQSRRDKEKNSKQYRDDFSCYQLCIITQVSLKFYFNFTRSTPPSRLIILLYFSFQNTYSICIQFQIHTAL